MPFSANCTPVGMAPVLPAALMSPRAVTCRETAPALRTLLPSAAVLTALGQMYGQLHGVAICYTNTSTCPIM